jgi:branched-chain amino acid transport system substrate-binding protein
MMKKLLALLAAILLLATLAACNPVDEDNSTGTPSTTSGGPQTSQADGAGGDDATGSDDSAEPVKLGFNLELTGDAATFGLSAQKGAEIAIEELKEEGGIMGRPVETVFDDNASQSAQAAQVASKLINQNNVDVVIGAVGSSQSIAMARIAEEAQVPMVTPASTNPAVTVENGEVRGYVFRTCFTDDFQGEGIVDFAVNGPLAAKQAVIFYDAENDYSVGIYETVKAVAPDMGLEIVAEDSYLSKSEQDFRPKLNRFKQAEFDVMIVPGYYNDVAKIANQARELGLEQPLLGGDGFDSPDLWKNAGANIEGSYFTNHYAADDMDPAVQNYISKYKQRYGGAVPDAMSILTYDAVHVVADAIERAGSTEPDAIAAALAQTAGYKGAAGSITINELHNATKKLVVLEVGEGGNLSWVYTYDPLSADGGDEEPAPAVEDGATEMGGDSGVEAAGGGGEDSPDQGDTAGHEGA